MKAITLRVAAFTISIALCTPLASKAATEAQTCRKLVGKAVGKLYKTVIGETQKCFKTRLAAGGSQDCLDPLEYDARDKVSGSVGKLADTMTGTKCASFDAAFFVMCEGAPAACAAACSTCEAAADASACLGCRVTQLVLAQVDAIYGIPPDVSGDSDAQKCQNAIGKRSGKAGRTRMKEQQKCQKQFDADKLRAPCRNVDLKGKIGKADGKASSSILKACLEKPGADQVPDLDASATCLGAGATGAATCAVDAAETAVDTIFDLASAPGGVDGFITVSAVTDELVPLAGVRIEISGANVGGKSDANGFYRVAGVPSGPQTIVIDGQGVGSYPRIPMGFQAPLVGIEHMGNFVMPPVDMANAVDVSPFLDANDVLTAPVTLSNPTIPDATLELPAGTQITFDVPNRAPLLSVNVIDIPVMPFPPDVISSVIYSFQPEGTLISPAADVTFPNDLGLGTGEQANIWFPDFTDNTFFLAGTGTVSGSGVIESDAPIVTRFDWHFTADPNAPFGCTTTAIGRTVDATTLAPLAGANVCFLGQCVVSASNGTFSDLIEVCPTTVTAAASVVDPGTALYLYGAGSAATVFNGTTDLGDITMAEPSCGDGTAQGAEDCDDGNNVGGDGCSPVCTDEICGDGFVDPGEDCDSTPGCTDLCTLCGDGVLRIPGEECDLGGQNGVASSGCASDCTISICGNGILESDEQCDEGNANGGSSVPCTADCTLDIAGDAVVVGAAVRKPVDCPGSVYPSPNTQTNDGTPACAPVVFDSDRLFGPAGRGSFLAAYAAGESDVLLRAELDDVRTSGSVPVADASGWRARWTLRITLRDPSLGGNPVTLEDQTVEAQASLGGPGEFDAAMELSDAIPLVLSNFDSSNIEVVSAAFVDPDGFEFARSGWLSSGTTTLTANQPSQANNGSSTLARQYAECTAPDVIVSGLDACTSAATLSPYRFGAAGQASWVYNGGSDLKMAIQAEDVREPDGVTPVEVPFSFTIVVHATINDVAGGDMIMIDFPIQFVVEKFKNGKVKRTFSLGQALAALGLADLAAAPKQGHFRVVELTDPNGDPFAGLGLRSIVAD